MKKIIKILVIILFILILACLASIWISYNWLTVTHFTVRSSKISEPFRIVLVSDLHEHQFGRDNEKLAVKIREQSPDLIIIDAPVYYSFGNHEYSYMEAGHEDLTEELEAAGAVVLNYQSIVRPPAGELLSLGYGGSVGDRSCAERASAWRAGDHSRGGRIV